jgi:hypothetical protein
MSKTTETNWIEEARQSAAQCWCEKETKHLVMEPDLAESVARKIAFWMDTAAQNEQNTGYYRSLLERCGKAIGLRAYTQDDGGVTEDVLCAKIPEIIEADYTR